VSEQRKPPKFIRDLLGKRYDIPNPEVPSVGGKPIVRVDTSPMRYEPRREIAG
jgi:hypothetical protein